MHERHPISEEVERFVLTSIPSVPYLEAVLFFRTVPSLPRTAGDVAHALYLTSQEAARLLQQMCEGGVVLRDDAQYRYAPSEALGRSIDALAEAYAGNLVGVTQLIHDVTRKSAQRFADAFKLRKDR